MEQKFLRLHSVMEIKGLSRSSIYLMIQRGEFPKNVRLNNFRAVAWIQSEIQEWIESRISSSRNH